MCVFAAAFSADVNFRTKVGRNLARIAIDVKSLLHSNPPSRSIPFNTLFNPHPGFCGWFPVDWRLTAPPSQPTSRELRAPLLPLASSRAHCCLWEAQLGTSGNQLWQATFEADHGTKRCNSGLPGELPQQFFRLSSPWLRTHANAPATWDAASRALHLRNGTGQQMTFH
jgi:hypothetical protein